MFNMSNINLWCFLNIITLSVSGAFKGDCNGAEDLMKKCPMSLPELSSPEITTREELDQSCVKLQTGIKCLNNYINVCLKKHEQVVFRKIYAGIAEVVEDLCTRGNNQDEYLKHANCVRTIRSEYETCSKKHEETFMTINQQVNQTRVVTSQENPLIRTTCCSFQEYLMCSEETVQRSCGDEAALFTSAYLERMASNIIKSYCFIYDRQECGLIDRGLHIFPSVIFVSVASLINLAFHASDHLVSTNSPGFVSGDDNTNVFDSDAEFGQYNSYDPVIFDEEGATAFGQRTPATDYWSPGNDNTEGAFGSTSIDRSSSSTGWRG